MIRDQNTGAQHIATAIQSLLKEYHLESRFDEANLVNSWERLMGKPIAKRTRKVFVRNKVVFVELDSPSMKQDLQYHKIHMLEILKREFGPDIVGEIVIM